MRLALAVSTIAALCVSVLLVNVYQPWDEGDAAPRGALLAAPEDTASPPAAAAAATVDPSTAALLASVGLAADPVTRPNGTFSLPFLGAPAPFRAPPDWKSAGCGLGPPPPLTRLPGPADLGDCAPVVERYRAACGDGGTGPAPAYTAEYKILCVLGRHGRGLPVHFLIGSVVSVGGGEPTCGPPNGTYDVLDLRIEGPRSMEHAFFATPTPWFQVASFRPLDKGRYRAWLRPHLVRQSGDGFEFHRKKSKSSKVPELPVGKCPLRPCGRKGGNSAFCRANPTFEVTVRDADPACPVATVPSCTSVGYPTDEDQYYGRWFFECRSAGKDNQTDPDTLRTLRNCTEAPHPVVTRPLDAMRDRYKHRTQLLQSIGACGPSTPHSKFTRRFSHFVFAERAGWTWRPHACRPRTFSRAQAWRCLNNTGLLAVGDSVSSTNGHLLWAWLGLTPAPRKNTWDPAAGAAYERTFTPEDAARLAKNRESARGDSGGPLPTGNASVPVNDSLYFSSRGNRKDELYGVLQPEFPESREEGAATFFFNQVVRQRFWHLNRFSRDLEATIRKAPPPGQRRWESVAAAVMTMGMHDVVGFTVPKPATALYSYLQGFAKLRYPIVHHAATGGVAMRMCSRKNPDRALRVNRVLIRALRTLSAANRIPPVAILPTYYMVRSLAWEASVMDDAACRRCAALLVALWAASGQATPTPTKTQSPTGTATLSASLTASETRTATETETVTETVTVTATETETETETIFAHTNYSTAIAGALPPDGTFEEGQELRLRWTAVFDGADPEGTPRHHFNTSDPNGFLVRQYAWDPRFDRDCAAYASAGGALLLDSRDSFGHAAEAHPLHPELVATVFVTFTAPREGLEFIVCFKHDVSASGAVFRAPADIAGRWLAFGGGDVYRAEPASVKYHLPDPTFGQYAVVRLVATPAAGAEPWAFTSPDSACGIPGTGEANGSCAFGDGLKIVPAGAPCTHEVGAADYYGTEFVGPDGSWDPAGLPGLAEGATVGGVGLFGSETVNPLVDRFEGPSVRSGEAFVYVRIPLPSVEKDQNDDFFVHESTAERGSAYDVCYTSLRERRAARFASANSSIPSVPVWRRLPACPVASNCYEKPSSADPLAVFSFTPKRDPVGWTALDLSPLSWGTVVFDDSGENFLSSAPHTRPRTGRTSSPGGDGNPARPSYYDYWAPSGGDYFQWLPDGLFSEKYYDTTDPGGRGVRRGSFPSVGCWTREYDDVRGSDLKNYFFNSEIKNSRVSADSVTEPVLGGFVEESAPFAVGSRDLTGDPALEGAQHDAAGGQAAVFSTVFVPGAGQAGYICYRRTCDGYRQGADQRVPLCNKHAGMRVLPYHGMTPYGTVRGSPPSHWLHLPPDDITGWTYALHVYPSDGYSLVPTLPNFNETGDFHDESLDPVPDVEWYMNDTTEGTWGPIVFEKRRVFPPPSAGVPWVPAGSPSDTLTLATTSLTPELPYAWGPSSKADSRPWNFTKPAGFWERPSPPSTRSVTAQTTGSAFRLVPWNLPCDWPGFAAFDDSNKKHAFYPSTASPSGQKTGEDNQGLDLPVCAASYDGGEISCPTEHELEESYGTNAPHRCVGKSSDEAETELLAFYFLVPEREAAGYRVCYRHRGWNWRQISPAGTDGLYSTQSAWDQPDWNPLSEGFPIFVPTPSVLPYLKPVFTEQRAGMEVLFVVTDARETLSVSEDQASDVFRLVPLLPSEPQPGLYGQSLLTGTGTSPFSCDAVVDGRGDWLPSDTRLSVVCEPSAFPVSPFADASGSACARAPAFLAMCKGPCAADDPLLLAFLGSTPPAYRGVTPGAQPKASSLLSMAASVRLPEWRDDSAEKTYRLCYKRNASPNWTVFNETLRLHRPPSIQVSYPIPGHRPLVGGKLQRFKVSIHFPDSVQRHYLAPSVTSAASPLVFVAKLVRVGEAYGARRFTPFSSPYDCASNPHPSAVSLRARVFNVTKTPASGNATVSSQHIHFYLLVPNDRGLYRLCLHVPTLQYAGSDTAWWSPEYAAGSGYSYEVADNGVRWFVRKGQQPVNNGGQAVLNFARCGVRRGTGCDYDRAEDAFDVSPTGDRAKVIRMSSMCFDLEEEEDDSHSMTVSEIEALKTLKRSLWGQSLHRGRETATAAGLTDLEPGDGLVDTAWGRVTMPAQPDNRASEYKVCVKTHIAVHRGGGDVSKIGFEHTWIEVDQAETVVPEQKLLRNSQGDPSFITAPGVVKGWNLDTLLTPRISLFSYTSGGSATTAAGGRNFTLPLQVTALAGAATHYVSNPSWASTIAADPVAPTAATGFYFTSVADTVPASMTSGTFKLVLQRAPSVSDPLGPAGIDVSTWRNRNVNCEDPAVDGASNTVACVSGHLSNGSLGTVSAPACCGLFRSNASTGDAAKLFATFHIPVRAGLYTVCFKPADDNEEQPWSWVAEGGGDVLESEDAAVLEEKGYTKFVLAAQPAFLEAEVAQNGANVSVVDLRVVGGETRVGLASWCAPPDYEKRDWGVPCLTQNSGGFVADLLTIVNDTDVCPVPASAPWGSQPGLGGPSPPSEWFVLRRIGNATVAIGSASSWSGMDFILPPPQQSPTHRYKICVYKAGEADAQHYEIPESVTRKGVVYQVPMRFGSFGHWVDAGAVETKLTVSAWLPGSAYYNRSVQFMEVTDAGLRQYDPAFVPDPLVNFTSLPSVGMLSRTPVVRSGAIVQFVVTREPAINDDSAYVEVQRCLGTSHYSTTALKCDTPSAWIGPTIDKRLSQLRGSFWLEPTEASNCAGETAEKYDWAPSGLRQYLKRGVAVFSLRYASSCPAGPFGCGVVFTVHDGKGAVVSSAAQWINTRTTYPDALSVNAGPRLEPRAAPLAETCSQSNPSCSVISCRHGSPCTLQFQARRAASPFYSATGSFSLQYSSFDYPGESTEVVPPSVHRALGDSVSPAFVIRDWSAWGVGGEVTVRFTPTIVSGDAAAAVYLNASFEAAGAPVWTRFAVAVARVLPEAFRIAAVAPLDAALGLHLYRKRSPAPAVYGRRASARDSEFGLEFESFDVLEGGFLEALTPYEARLEVYGPNAESMDELSVWLSDWRITGRVVESAKCSVLLVPSDATESYFTEQDDTAEANRDFALLRGRRGMEFTLRFRVFVRDAVCSRFATPQADQGRPFAFGCTVLFTFLHESPPSYLLHAAVRTPVRVPASTVRVVPARPAPALIAHGILISALPGTFLIGSDGTETFIADEFHPGDVFALHHHPPGTPTSVVTLAAFVLDANESSLGAVSPWDGHIRYGTRGISVPGVGRSWGAQWVMRTSDPCIRCNVTFHTAWGAGPQSGDEEERGRAVSEFSLSGGALELSCPSVTVEYQSGRTASFSIAPAAVLQGTQTSAGYARWQVSFDLTNDVSYTTGGTAGTYRLRRHNDSTPSLVTMQMAPDTSRAVFDGLFFEGETAPTAGVPEVFEVAFQAFGSLYDETVDGTVMLPEVRRYQCVAQVTVLLGSVDSTRSIELVGATNADALCASSSNCNQWLASADQLTQGVSFAFRFTTAAADDAAGLDTSVKNLTVVPKGGPGTTPFGLPPSTWVYSGVSGTLATGSPVVLDSAYNKAPLDVRTDPVTKEEVTYTFGSVSVVVRRAVANAADRATVLGGEGSIVVVGSQPVTAVRDAVFAVCDSAWASGAEAVGVACFDVHLWVSPSARSATAIALWDQPPGGAKVKGSSTACENPTVLMLTVAAFYTLPAAGGGVRYYSYAEAVEYTITVPGAGQLLAFSSPAEATGGAAAALSKASGQAGLLETLPQAAHPAVTNDLPDVHTTFSFVGVRAVGGAEGGYAVRVSGAFINAGGVALGAVETTNSYYWVADPARVARWDVAPRVTVDAACEGTRMLQSAREGYRTYSTRPPGHGWAFAADNGVSVGVPFPLQVTLSDAAGARAAAGVDTLVRVSKLRLEGGCNDGGELRLHSLLPVPGSAGAALLKGNLGSFVEHDAAGVVLPHSAAVVWPVFAAPCRLCALAVDLCYANRSLDDCLRPPAHSSGGGETGPLLADRRKVTKSFEVKHRPPTAVHVYAQRLPRGLLPGGGGVARTGESFAVELAPVIEFNGGPGEAWAMEPPRDQQGRYALRVYARVSWVPGEAPVVKYGSGGLLGAAAAAELAAAAGGGGCAPTTHAGFWRAPGAGDHEQQLLPLSAAGGGDPAQAAAFHFTRPCSLCRVRLRWAVADGGVVVAQGSFVLREYAYTTTTKSGGFPVVGAPLAFGVVTCGVGGWAVFGPPPVAVHRRQPFSVTLRRADGEYHAATGGAAALQDAARERFPNETVAAVAATITVEPRLLPGGGNGDGGTLERTAHFVSEIAGAAPGLAQSVTLRLRYTAACYACTVQFLVREEYVFRTPDGRNLSITTASRAEWTTAVLTDATRVHVLPSNPAVSDGGAPPRLSAVPSSLAAGASFVVSAFAGDDDGHRAFSAAGPTAPALRPAYRGRPAGHASRVPAVAAVEIGARGSVWELDPGVFGGAGLRRVAAGGAAALDVFVGGGRHWLNGIPMPELDPPQPGSDAPVCPTLRVGLLCVSVKPKPGTTAAAALPLLGYPVALTLSGVPRGDPSYFAAPRVTLAVDVTGPAEGYAPLTDSWPHGHAAGHARVRLFAMAYSPQNGSFPDDPAAPGVWRQSVADAKAGIAFRVERCAVRTFYPGTDVVASTVALIGAEEVASVLTQAQPTQPTTGRYPTARGQAAWTFRLRSLPSPRATFHPAIAAQNVTCTAAVAVPRGAYLLAAWDGGAARRSEGSLDFYAFLDGAAGTGPLPAWAAAAVDPAPTGQPLDLPSPRGLGLSEQQLAEIPRNHPRSRDLKLGFATEATGATAGHPLDVSERTQPTGHTLDASERTQPMGHSLYVSERTHPRGHTLDSSEQSQFAVQRETASHRAAEAASVGAWGSTDTVAVVSRNATVVVGYSTRGRRVEVRVDGVAAAAETLRLDGAAMAPAGCFVCEERAGKESANGTAVLRLCAATPAPGGLSVWGRFAASAAAACVLADGAAAAVAGPSFSVVLQHPERLAVVVPYTRLVGRTEDGSPAAVAGGAGESVPAGNGSSAFRVHGTEVELAIVDGNGTPVVSDSVSIVRLRGSRGGGSDHGWTPPAQRVTRGVAQFALAAATDTGRRPWVFAASAAVPYALPASPPLALALEPLHFVRRAVALQARLQLVDDAAADASEPSSAAFSPPLTASTAAQAEGDDASREPVRWIEGVPLGVVVFAVDEQGRRVRGASDEAAAFEVRVDVVGVPCAAMDAAPVRNPAGIGEDTPHPGTGGDSNHRSAFVGEPPGTSGTGRFGQAHGSASVDSTRERARRAHAFESRAAPRSATMDTCFDSPLAACVHSELNTDRAAYSALAEAIRARGEAPRHLLGSLPPASPLLSCQPPGGGSRRQTPAYCVVADDSPAPAPPASSRRECPQRPAAAFGVPDPEPAAPTHSGGGKPYVPVDNTDAGGGYPRVLRGYHGRVDAPGIVLLPDAPGGWGGAGCVPGDFEGWRVSDSSAGLGISESLRSQLMLADGGRGAEGGGERLLRVTVTLLAASRWWAPAEARDGESDQAGDTSVGGGNPGPNTPAAPRCPWGYWSAFEATADHPPGEPRGTRLLAEVALQRIAGVAPLAVENGAAAAAGGNGTGSPRNESGAPPSPAWPAAGGGVFRCDAARLRCERLEPAVAPWVQPFTVHLGVLQEDFSVATGDHTSTAVVTGVCEVPATIQGTLPSLLAWPRRGTLDPPVEDSQTDDDDDDDDDDLSARLDVFGSPPAVRSVGGRLLLGGLRVTGACERFVLNVTVATGVPGKQPFRFQIAVRAAHPEGAAPVVDPPAPVTAELSMGTFATSAAYFAFAAAVVPTEFNSAMELLMTATMPIVTSISLEQLCPWSWDQGANLSAGCTDYTESQRAAAPQQDLVGGVSAVAFFAVQAAFPVSEDTLRAQVQQVVAADLGSGASSLLRRHPSFALAAASRPLGTDSPAQTEAPPPAASTAVPSQTGAPVPLPTQSPPSAGPSSAPPQFQAPDAVLETAPIEAASRRSGSTCILLLPVFALFWGGCG
ncbi:hypothetical protein DIPPA_22953 [Diplonema papillatum]|nr:hypothetical protein DIPPA_22953 [Diplonema papillatum]